jgi:hypothetical protein
MVVAVRHLEWTRVAGHGECGKPDEFKYRGVKETCNASGIVAALPFATSDAGAIRVPVT